ncbi:MAG: permease-like cell division protein FtsX [Oscillospiraceae bacterium]|nr:permease-like cell division protein FtsX [Oscillospiraceae bacterium]
MNSIGYLIRQGIRNTINNGVMSLASVGVLFSCLLLIGSSVLVSLNLNNIISDIEHQNEIVVFLNDDISEEQTDNISEFLSNKDFIDVFEFITKDEALEKHINITGNNKSLFESLKDDNPLPDTYNIVLSDLSEIEDFIEELENFDGVEKVNAPVEVANMIVSIKHTIGIAGIVVVFVLLLVSLVIISNTIKLTIYNRKKEINIMKFVGASDIFIKLPFVVEGIFIGLMSAVLSYLVLWQGYNYLILKMSEVDLQWVSNIYNNIILFKDYNLYILAGFSVVGLFIGLLGSSFFVRKYLKV